MRTIGTLAAVLTFTAIAACSPSRPGDGNGGADGGSGGNGGDGGDNGSDGSNSGSNGDDGCSVASQFVYVVDQNNDFSSFDPTTKTFTKIGALDCPDSDGSATPFSMGVDRNANAYVLYSNGQLFQVTGISAGSLQCAATGFKASSDFANFGMGFSTTEAGGTTDQLFVAGGPVEDPNSPLDPTATAKFQTIDVGTYKTASVGSVTGWPELTGNSAAELWGWFPSGTSTPQIRQINKASGATIGTPYSLKTLKGEPSAWAFAAYGGDLWVFLARFDETTGDPGTTSVYQVGGAASASPGTIKSTTATPDGTLIVGAGVSTCAPNVIM